LEAIGRARDAALTSGQELVFPQGQYLIRGPLELGFARLHVRGIGRVVIQAAFDQGNVVSFDAGEQAIAYQSSFRNFIIRGTGSPNQSGLFIRNVVHGVREDIRVRNVGHYAFHIVGDVFSNYRNLVSDTQNDGAGQEGTPIADCHVDGSAAVSATTACIFENLILENGRQHGLYLAKAANNVFKGGGAEGLEGTGVFVSAEAHRNHFEQFYCEANHGGDFDVRGQRNAFINCEAYDPERRTTQFAIRPGAVGNAIEKCGAIGPAGAMTIVQIEAGASDTIIRDCDLYRLIDSGNRTVLENYSDAFAGRSRTGGRSFGNGANSDPRVLDWYEEGKFAPRFAGTAREGNLGYQSATGEFQRIGNRVLFSLAVQAGQVTSPPSGGLLVKGLPYASAAATFDQAAAVGNYRGLSWPAGTTQIGAHLAGAAIRIVGLMNGRSEPFSATALKSGDMIAISGSYSVDG
jgi:hypothetical protein